MKTRKTNNRRFIVFIKLVFVFLVLITFVLLIIKLAKPHPDTNTQPKYTTKITEYMSKNRNQNEEKYTQDRLEIYFLDVGQAESIVLQIGDDIMVVDGGNVEDYIKVASKLQQLATKDIDILVGTHAHEDHMGDFSKIISKFDVKKVYTPDYRNTTIQLMYYQLFEEVMNSKRIAWKYVTPDDVGKYIEFASAKIQVLGPMTTNNTNYNDDSIVLMVEFEDSKILLMADAEKKIERLIMEAGYDISADAIKLGHHGSSTSSSKLFIETVNPQIAIISAEKGHVYELPKESTMETICSLGIIPYRTDECGDIHLTVDDGVITVYNESGTYEGY